ncbi:DUF6233 domain-containing protein [Streptomyces sp. NPDC090442]|uniref:DUF6233 domain-containing protein n=1 Tax=Streptomyces sp. NPDC090442 TaxID=3365962 RepID=UPI003812AECB
MYEHLWPTDTHLLRVLERYLSLQLAEVRRRLAAAEGAAGRPVAAAVPASTGPRPRPAAAAEWVIQVDVGRTRRPIAVHRGGCPDARGPRTVPATRRDAVDALAAGVPACLHCAPDRALGLDL